MLRKPPPRALLAYSTLYAVVVLASLPLYPYKWHLLLHILGAVVFVGNIIVTAAWMVLAERTRELRVIRFATRAVNRADLLFTGPGVALVLLNGLAIAADRWGGWANFYEHSWIALALALFAASGIVWVAFLMRYQTRMAGPLVSGRGGRRKPAPGVLQCPPQVVRLGGHRHGVARRLLVSDGGEARVVVTFLARDRWAAV